MKVSSVLMTWLEDLLCSKGQSKRSLTTINEGSWEEEENKEVAAKESNSFWISIFLF